MFSATLAPRTKSRGIMMTLDGSLTRLWGEGSFNVARFPIPALAQTQTYYEGILTLSVSNFGGEEIWNTGTDDDFPALDCAFAQLARRRRRRGAFARCRNQRRDRHRDAAGLRLTMGNLARSFEAIRIERITDDIPALNCAFSDGALRAQMGYNMATAIIELIAFDAELAQRGDADSCEIDILNNSGGDATLRFIYASRADPDAPESALDDGLQFDHRAGSGWGGAVGVCARD